MIDRRSFMGTAAAALVATQIPSSIRAAQSGTFDALKRIDAGVLNVGYVDTGPANGSPVLLLHGWPYDIYSYVDVVPLLTAKGYRVVVPYFARLRRHD